MASVGRNGSATGAWAAAAVVLAVGALAFAVNAHYRLNNMQRAMDEMQSRTVAVDTTVDRITTTTRFIPGSALSTAPTTAAPNPGRPDDTATAETAIRAAFATAFDASKPITERLGAIDDSRGVAAALQAAVSGQFKDQASNSRGSVATITFTSRASADVMYSVLIGGQVQGDPKLGSAREAGGTWKVTRSTVCSLLESISAPCG
jgi:hypothetical protein